MPPRQGAFAGWVCVPGRNLVAVPDAVPLEKAALTEPLACGWHAVRLGREALGGKGTRDGAGVNSLTALVIGAGAIGLGAALCLSAQGIGNVVIVESNPLRRAYIATRTGRYVVAPDKLASHQQGQVEEVGQRQGEGEATDQGRLFDLVIDAVGVEATRLLASRQVRLGGVIAHIGLGSAKGGLDIRRMTLQEVTFIGTYTYTMQDFRDTAQALFDGRLGALDWVECRALSQGALAFSDICEGCVSAPKILLRPD